MDAERPSVRPHAERRDEGGVRGNDEGGVRGRDEGDLLPLPLGEGWGLP